MEKIAEFLNKYWVLVLGIIFVVPFIIKYVKAFAVETVADKIDAVTTVNNAENAVNSPVIQKTKAQVIFAKYKTPVALQNERLGNATNIFHNLGLAYAGNTWFDFGINPKSWSENDDEVGKILKRQGNNLDTIAELYYGVITQSRNMKNDILKYCDTDTLTDVRAFWKRNKIKEWL